MAQKEWKLIQTIGVVGCVAAIPLGFALESVVVGSVIGVGALILYATGRFAVWWNQN